MNDTTKPSTELEPWALTPELVHDILTTWATECHPSTEAVRLPQVLMLQSQILDAIKAWNTRDNTPEDPWKGIDSAPRDGTKLLFAGQWNKECAVERERGTWIITVATWSTFDSTPKAEYAWITDGIGTLSSYTVDWSHWMPLPEGPSQ